MQEDPGMFSRHVLRDTVSQKEKGGGREGEKTAERTEGRGRGGRKRNKNDNEEGSPVRMEIPATPRRFGSKLAWRLNKRSWILKS